MICVWSVFRGVLPLRSGEPLRVGISSQVTLCFPISGAQVVFQIEEAVKRVPSPLLLIPVLT